MGNYGVSSAPAVGQTAGRRRARRLTAVLLGALVVWFGASGSASAATAYDALTSVGVGTQPYDVVVYEAGARAYVANYGSNSVSVLSTSTNAVVATVPVGAAPVGIVVDQATGRVYVTNSGASSLSVIDAATNAVVATVPLPGCAGPALPSLDPATGLVYVPCDGSGSVAVVDPATNTVSATIPLGGGSGVWASAVTGGRLYVTNYATGVVTILALPSNAVLATLALGGEPVGLAVDPVTGAVYVAQRTAGTVTVIQGTAATATWTVGGVPNAIAVAPGGGFALVALRDTSTLLVVDTSTGATTATVTLPNPGPTRVAIDPTTGTAFVTHWVSGGTGSTVTVVAVSPTITTTTFPDGVTGTAYSATVAASGTPAISYAVSAGALPAGVTLDPATGALSGTPTAPGTFTFTLTATNSAGSDSHAYTVVVRQPPQVTTTTLPDGVTLTGYAASVVATGTAPITYVVTAGSLPPGIVLGASGALTGTPTTAGTFTVTVTATNSVGTSSATLTILVRAVPTITTTTLPGATEGVAYGSAVQAGGTAPMSYAVTAGALPPGVSLDPVTGVLSGTPSVSGTFSFTVTVTNPAGAATQVLILLVSAPALPPAPPAHTAVDPPAAAPNSPGPVVAQTGTTVLAQTGTTVSTPLGLGLGLAGLGGLLLFATRRRRAPRSGLHEHRTRRHR